MTDAPDVLVETIDGVGWVRINRPHVRNALRTDTMIQLCAALDALADADEVRVIVLIGVGQHFIAGADLNDLQVLGKRSEAEIRDTVYSHPRGVARRLYTSPKPTIAAVRGAAITLGCEFAICCDFRVVTPSAMFQEKWIHASTIPPLGGLKLLPQLIGTGAAKDMVLRGKPVRGEEAVRLGLAHELVAEDQLEAGADALAQELRTISATAYAAAKAGLNRGLESSMEDEWQANVSAQAALIASSDFTKGVSAFRKREIPSFAGRQD